MTTATELTESLLAALDDVPGLRPAAPGTALVVRDPRALAVAVSPGVVELRVVAGALPLRPVLRRALERLRSTVAGTPWEGALLRIVVADLDACAVRDNGSHSFGA